MSTSSDSRSPATPPRPYVAHRADGWTYRRQVDFLVALDLTRNISRSAAAVGMSVNGYYRFCRRPGGERFAARCAAILAQPRALAIAPLPFDNRPQRVDQIFRMGKLVGTRRSDDTRGILARLVQLDRVIDGPMTKK